MILTMDVGNSNIVTIVYDENRTLLFKKRETTLKQSNKEDYRQLFLNLKQDLKQIEISTIILSCVVPSMSHIIVEALEEVFGLEVDEIKASKVPDLKVPLPNPDELGSDFVAAALGAFYQYDKPVIVVDMGSATKIFAIDQDFNFLGAVIQLGVGLQADALHERIPHLPPIELTKPKKVLGLNTIETIQVGIVGGAIASVTKLTEMIEEEIGEPCAKVLTGGFANLFLDDDYFTIDLNLLSEGLFYYSRQEKHHGK